MAARRQHTTGAQPPEDSEQTPDSGGLVGAESGTDEQSVARFVERFAADLTEAGMQRMAARVFACLLASDDGALTAAQLAERLQASPAAISGSVRYLSQLHLVGRERQPGSRREQYRVQEDVWYEAYGAGRNQFLNRMASSLGTGVEAVGRDTAAGRRLQESREFMDFMQREMDGVMERWRQRHPGESP